jgi:hypothetical protein
MTKLDFYLATAKAALATAIRYNNSQDRIDLLQSRYDSLLAAQGAPNEEATAG